MDSPQSGLLAVDWQLIWQEHSGWIRTVLRARLGCDRLADEMLQDVHVAAWSHRDQLCDRQRVAPWLYRIALRQVWLHWRRADRGLRLVRRAGDWARSQARDPMAEDPLSWLTRREVHRAVRESLQALTPQEREILLLKHTEHWTYGQIAQHLGLSLDKVIYRISKAQQRLRQKLLALGPD